MIPFFRKIRKQLADDNKPTKYMRYAIGEIVLVVIGILIAIQINNWNEERILKESVKVYLSSLVEDIENDIKILGGGKNNQLFRFHCMQQLLAYADHSKNQPVEVNLPPYSGESAAWRKEIPKTIDLEFLIIAFDYTSRLTQLAPRKSTLDELKSSGLFSFIQNDEIVDGINKYYRNFEWRLGESENQNILLFRNSWTNVLVDNGYNSTGLRNYENAIEWLKSDPKGVAVLRNLISNAEWRYICCVALYQEANELVKSINEYILKPS